MLVNKYQFAMVGLIVPVIDFVSVTIGEQEIPMVEMPDRTRVTSGQTSPVEITAKVPSHHTDQITAMQLWYREGQDPVTPTYKKAGVLTVFSGEGNSINWTVTGAWCSKYNIDDLDMANDADAHYVEFTIQVDDLTPIGLPL